MNLTLQEILIIGSCTDQVKFSELTMDMFRMLQTLEREPQDDYNHLYDTSPAPVHGSGTGRGSGGYAGVPGSKGKRCDERTGVLRYLFHDIFRVSAAFDQSGSFSHSQVVFTLFFSFLSLSSRLARRLSYRERWQVVQEGQSTQISAVQAFAEPSARFPGERFQGIAAKRCIAAVHIGRRMLLHHETSRR